MTLNLSGSLTDDANVNAAWLPDALLVHCPYLRDLNLSNNNLGVPGASAISRILSYNEPNDRCRLASIFLNRTNLGDKGLSILIKGLKFNFQVIPVLGLQDNNIHAFGALSLANSVCSGKLMIGMLSVSNLTSLDLSDNPLGLEGSAAVGRVFSSNHCQLGFIILSRCELTTAGQGDDLTNTDGSNTVPVKSIGQQLCQMPQSNTICWLELNGNNFTGEGIHILAGFIHLCPCATLLHTGGCGITSEDLIWLLDKLIQLKSSSPNLCSKLQSWSLWDNQIDDSGVSVLIDCLPLLFPGFGCMGIAFNFLMNNPVSEIMMQKVKEELRRWQKNQVSCSIFIINKAIYFNEYLSGEINSMVLLKFLKGMTARYVILHQEHYNAV